MIMFCYRLMCAWMAGLVVWGLFTEGEFSCALGPLNLSMMLVVLALALVVKKGFCGWACPIGFLGELAARLGGWVWKRRPMVPAKVDGRLRLLRYGVLAVVLWFTYRAGELVLRGYDPFYLIFSAYVVIWLVTGDLNSITQSLLGLMGISAATALGGAVIDNQKRDAATAELAKLSRTPSPSVSPPGGDATIPVPSRSDTVRQLEERLDPGVSQGFLRDILGDRNGVSLDRFLIVAWNLALGTIFIATVYTTLAMPDFSASLLGLMGISAGTYLGLKVPEREP